MRYAIYYTPPRPDPLTRLATSWLGRCAFTGEVFAPVATGRLSAAEVAYQTAAARRYGFHATLVAPFVLAEDQTEQGLRSALAAFCDAQEAFCVPRLKVGRIDGFFALAPETPSAWLDRLARDVVLAFDRFRAPLSEAERARRGGAHLTPPQLRNLLRWGDPYVFEDFRFHMTLTGRVDEAEATRVHRAIEEHFGPILDEPLEVGWLALFLEPEPGAPFVVRSLHEFDHVATEDEAERRTA